MRVYDIEKTFLYNVFEDYLYSQFESEKNEIARAFFDTLWSVPNDIQIYDVPISYCLLDRLNDEERSVFSPYNTITYTTHKSFSKNMNAWYLLRQKINNIYVLRCDRRVCNHRDYISTLEIPKKLYYQYIEKNTSLSLSEIKTEIDNSISKSERLLKQYINQKLKISWDEFKIIVERFLLKCISNYIPIDQNKKNNRIHVNVDCWPEDNYIIKYLSKSLDGYMKNFNKEYHHIKRTNKTIKEKPVFLQNQTNRTKTKEPILSEFKTIKCIVCGDTFQIKKNNKKTKRCSVCQHKHDKLRKREYIAKVRHNK
jgi:hypothetical protein